MIPHFRTVSPTPSPRASSPISTATVASCPRPRPRAELGLTALALAFALSPGCAYLNTFYNARQSFDEGVRLSAGSDSLPAAAAESFRLAAEKSAIVIERYPDSEYVDDALFLMAESFYRIGSWSDAAASYQRYATRFPEGEHAAAARLGWARAERRLGDHAAAEAALAPLLSAGSDVPSTEVVYEHALILLATGQRDRAADTYQRLLTERPEFAADRELTLEFADAQLAAGEYEAALAAYRALAAAVADPQRRREIEIRTARALTLEGRPGEALAAYERVLAGAVIDSLAAEVEVERGELLQARAEWGPATEAFRRAAELAPGSAAASRATLHRGRIVWKREGRREEALDILLDAFIHSPSSAWGDSARAESRALARLLHFQRIADGDVPVPQIEDPGLARSTAMYRLAEEVLEVEGDREAAAEMFWQLVERFPESPWRPWAMLASGILLSQTDGDAGTGTGAVGIGVARLLALIDADPDHPASDSARRQLGFEVPARPSDFYATDPTLAVLARVLPRETDPMLGIEDQMNRYGGREQTSQARLRSMNQQLELERERQTDQTPDPAPEGEPGEVVDPPAEEGAPAP